MNHHAAMTLDNVNINITDGTEKDFIFFKKTGKNFIFSADMVFHDTNGAAGLLFRSASADRRDNCYAARIDGGKCWISRYENGEELFLSDPREIAMPPDGKITLSVIALGSWIQCRANHQLIASTGDYIIQKKSLGQNQYYAEGCPGLLFNQNGLTAIQNIRYAEIPDIDHIAAKDIIITSPDGDTEAKAQFRPLEPITIQYVKYNAERVNINILHDNPGVERAIQDADGVIYPDGENIPVKQGENNIAVILRAEFENQFDNQISQDGINHKIQAEIEYKINIIRRQPENIYYHEPYRGQYHYSVKDGWANDPNGLVYYQNQWHLFYQFDTDTAHQGPVFWAHAVSRDLLHWQERPVAFYPDANGWMFSGCVVADENNISGLFDNNNNNNNNNNNRGGLIAFITADGNGQRVKIAYSEDSGETWIKTDRVILSWSENDPLRDKNFRDPKVFRWDNQWFMVIAGGPLRIFSSRDLLHWTCESVYPEWETECPDLYPVRASDGNIKWIFSRCGRFYKIGDFVRNHENNWIFKPDPEYLDSDGVMNFGQDSYAAMTFYIQDFGTPEHPTLPDILEINWMNTWNDLYSHRVAATIYQKTGIDQKFNGTFNLILKLGLISNPGGGYLLTQTPIEKYQDLRENPAVIMRGAKISGQIPLNIRGDCYEIDAVFYPGPDAREIGFHIRTGDHEKTVIIYYLKDNILSIDRSESGVLISDVFQTPDRVSVRRDIRPDGGIDFHIFADRSSVEVFAQNFTAAGAEQIFPGPDSAGIEIFSSGGESNLDLILYPMRSVWEPTPDI